MAAAVLHISLNILKWVIKKEEDIYAKSRAIQLCISFSVATKNAVVIVKYFMQSYMNKGNEGCVLSNLFRLCLFRWSHNYYCCHL